MSFDFTPPSERRLQENDRVYVVMYNKAGFITRTLTGTFVRLERLQTDIGKYRTVALVKDLVGYHKKASWFSYEVVHRIPAWNLKELVELGKFMPMQPFVSTHN